MVEIHAPSSARARSWRPRARSSWRMRERSSPAARLRVGDDEQRVDVEALVADRAHEALDEHGRLAGAGARGDEDAPAGLDRGGLLGIHARPTRHIDHSWHHAGHSPPFGSWCTSPVLMRPASTRAVSRGSLDLRPEGVVVEVVVRDETRQVVARVGAEQPAGAAVAGQRPVDAAERLEPDQVAQHEHVERDLEPQLLLDGPRGVGGLAGLVVLHDRARRERLDVDAVDLPGQGEPVSELEPRRVRPLAAERDLETVRHEAGVPRCLVADERFQVAREPGAQLPPLEVAHLHADAADRLVEARVDEHDGRVGVAVLEVRRAELLLQPAEETVERRVGDGAAQLGVDLGVDRARVDDALHQPGRRAVGEALELRDVEGRAGAPELEDGRVADERAALLGAEGAVEAAVPAVRAGERLRLAAGLLGARERGDGAQPLAVARRRLERPGERRERAAARPADDVVRFEERSDLLPERARFPGRAFVGGRLAHQVEPPRGPRAGRVEEVAVASDRVGALEARAELDGAGRRRGTARTAAGEEGSPLPGRARRRRRSGVCGRGGDRRPRRDQAHRRCAARR